MNLKMNDIFSRCILQYKLMYLHTNDDKEKYYSLEDINKINPDIQDLIICLTNPTEKYSLGFNIFQTRLNTTNKLDVFNIHFINKIRDLKINSEIGRKILNYLHAHYLNNFKTNDNISRDDYINLRMLLDKNIVYTDYLYNDKTNIITVFQINVKLYLTRSTRILLKDKFYLSMGGSIHTSEIYFTNFINQCKIHNVLKLN